MPLNSMPETPSSPNTPRHGLPANAGSMSRSKADPGANDKALLQHFERLLGQPVTIRTRWIDPQVGDSFEAVQGVDWPEMTFEQAASILNTIEAMMLPADRRSTLGLLLQLWHATAKTGISEEDMQIKSATYVDDLRDYPGDVTRCVLTMARKRFKFFPTVAELVEECESMVVKRRWLLRTLQHRMKRLQQLAIVHSTTLRDWRSSEALAIARHWGFC
jgi:hypothetical protein